jgi:putative ABC transport system substrate-binding protein
MLIMSISRPLLPAGADAGADVPARQLSAINRHNRQLFDLLVGAKQAQDSPQARNANLMGLSYAMASPGKPQEATGKPLRVRHLGKPSPWEPLGWPLGTTGLAVLFFSEAQEGQMSICLRRREFIAALGGAAAWPLAARAQQGARMRRIGVLMTGDESPGVKALVSALTQALAGLGWTDGRNVRMDLRWGGGDINRTRASAQELVGLQPDIIMAGGGTVTVALQQETRTIPIVFVMGPDPVASGIVARLDRPGGNATGFAARQASLGGKWLELLSEIAPGLKRAAFMFNPDTPLASAYMPSLETAAQSLKVEPIIAPVHSDAEIESAIIALGREPGGGLVVVPDGFIGPHRASIILAAARNNVPAISYFSAFARDGGLLSYGPDQSETFRRAASYVDRILRGDKPGDLPVQFPTKFEMVVNRKTATALGLEVPLSILVRADEVIE